MKKRRYISLILASLAVIATMTSCVKHSSPSSDVTSAITEEQFDTKFKWADDYSSASLVISRDSKVIDEIKANVTINVINPATCETKGENNYVAKATYKNKEYSETKTRIINELNHDYNSPTYTWSSDYKTCKATAVCKNDSSHIVEETVNASYQIIDEATYEKDGKGLYSAIFTNNLFKSQTKEVTIDKKNLEWEDATYEWSDDNTICVAKRVCITDPNKSITETKNSTFIKVDATCELDGLITYNAEFENSLFETQTKEVKIYKLNHNYKFSEFEWSSDYKTCKAKLLCENNQEHIKYEELEVTRTIVRNATCEEKGITKYSVFYETFTDSHEVEDIDLIDHNYDIDNINWSWNGYTKCIAVLTCKINSNHKLEIDATITSAITNNPTCIDDGERTYTASITYNGKIYTNINPTKEKINKLNHDYNTPIYTWSNNHESCCARTVCKNDSNHIVEESAIAVYSTKKAATFDEDGIGLYTVIFTNSLFEKQEYEIVIPKNSLVWEDPTYAWSSDNSKCIATRVCVSDSSKNITEEVETTVSQIDAECEIDGKKIYTATFENVYFETQTKEIKIDKLGHEYDMDNLSWSWTGFDSVSVTLTCKKNHNHVKVLTNATITSKVLVNPTCDVDGQREYTASIIIGGKTYTNVNPIKETINKTGHNYKITYEWNSTNTKVKATRECLNDSTEAKVVEEVSAVAKNTVKATKTSAGYITYSASFTNSFFMEQSKNINIYYVEFLDNDDNLYYSLNDVQENTIAILPQSNPFISTDGNNTLTYVFNGWYDNSSNRADKLNITSNNIVFKPKFVKYELAINIATAGSVSGLKDDTITASSTKVITANINNGYLFAGWDITANGITTRYNGSTLKTATKTSARCQITNYVFNSAVDVKLEAIYVELPVVITNETSSYGTVNVNVIHNNTEVGRRGFVGENIKVVANTNVGYAFKGYFYNNNLARFDSNNIPILEFDVQTYENMDIINYEAKWIKSPIDVSVNDLNMGKVTGYDGTTIVGETKTLIAEANTGYSFLEWRRNGNSYSTEEIINVKINDTDTITSYTAIFKAYTLTTSSNNYAAATITPDTEGLEQNMTVGKTITLKVKLNEGYTFLGWYLNGSSTPMSTDLETSFVMPQEDVVLIAKFTSYTLTVYNTNSTAGEVLTPYNQTKVTVGKLVSLEAELNSGYTFLGWYDFDTDTLINSNLSYTFDMPERNVRINAKFTSFTLKATAQDDLGTVLGYSSSNSSIVTFNLNGGTGIINPQLVSTSDDTSLKYPDTLPMKEGYVFNGWYKDIELAQLYDFTSVINGNITLYAGYTKMHNTGLNKYVADFTNVHNNKSNPYVLDLTNTSSTNTNDLYFTAFQTGNIRLWIKVNNSSISDYINIYNVTKDEAMHSSIEFASISYQSYDLNVSLGDVIKITNYASNSSSVSFYVEGNTISSDGGLCGDISYANDIKITALTSVVLKAIPNPGYTFKGWYDNNDNLVNENSIWSFEKKKENEIYKAVFEYYTFTLNKSYKNNDIAAGEVLSNYNNTKVTVGDEIELEATVNEGYTFLGYFVSGTNNLVSSDLKYKFNMTKNNIVYEARYTYYLITIENSDPNKGSVGGISDANYVYVDFESNGANETYDRQIVKSNSPITYPGNPTKDGYVFMGWYKDSLLKELFDFEENLTSSITLYAGFYQLTLANYKSLNTIDIVNTANSEDTEYRINNESAINENANFVYFRIPRTGIYRLYYRNDSSVTDFLSSLQVYNVIKETYIRDSNTGINNEKYSKISYVEFYASTADIIWLKTYSQSVIYSSTLSFYLVENNQDVLQTPQNSQGLSLCGPLEYINQKIEKGKTVKIVAEAKEGYTFTGWYRYDDSISDYVFVSSEKELSIIIGTVDELKYKAFFE